MKRIFVLILLFTLLPFTVSWGDYLGIKKSSEQIAAPITLPLDSLGYPGTPDSIHVFTYADNATTASYKTRSVTAPFNNISIDTTKGYGGTRYWLVDAISDIDGTGGNFQLAIEITAWYKTLPTQTFHTVQVISDSLTKSLDSARAAWTAADAVRDTAQYLTVATIDTASIARSVWDNDIVIQADRIVDATATIDTASIARSVWDNDIVIEANRTVSATATIDTASIARSVWDNDIIIEANRTVSATATIDTASIARSVWDNDIVSQTNRDVDVAEVTANAIDADAIADDAITHAKIASSAIGNDEIATNAIQASELSYSAAQEIADSVWLKDTSSVSVVNKMGELMDARISSAGGVAAIADADMSAIADSVWQASLEEHDNVAGSFGNSANSWSNTSLTGAGSYPVTITAFDSSTSQVVAGAQLSIFNVSLSALLAIGNTDQQGNLKVNLDSGSCVISTFAPGYIFAAYDTISILGSGADSLIGYRFNPGSPNSPELCRVFGYFYGIDGAPIEGIEVSAEISSSGVRYNDIIISQYRHTSETDSTGYFYFDLISSSDLNPAGTAYSISAVYPAGTILKKTIQVPDNSNWQLTW